MIGVRKIMHTCLLPFQNSNLKETDLFQFDFESETNSDIDLEAEMEAEMEAVKAQKVFWDKVDKKHLN